MTALFPDADPTGPVGLSTFEWMLGGQFLVQRTEFSSPGPPEAVSIVGPDAEGANFRQHYFDERGVARLYAMTCGDGIWTLQRDTADFTALPFQQRFIGAFSDDGGTIVGRWEVSGDGSSWELDFGLTYTRVV
jgi:hypothetical protein